MAYKVYYDKVSTGTSETTLTFFAHNEADDGTLVTNLASDSQLPESFSIERIELIVPPSISITDAENLMKGIMEIKVGDTTYLKCPVALAFSDNALRVDSYIEPGNTGTTATQYTSTVNRNDGLKLEEPISVPANTRFNIFVYLPSAFGTDTELLMVLHGKTA